MQRYSGKSASIAIVDEFNKYNKEGRQMLINDPITNKVHFIFGFNCYRSFLLDRINKKDSTLHRNHLIQALELLGSVLILNDAHPDLDPLSRQEKERQILQTSYDNLASYLEQNTSERYHVRHNRSEDD